METEEPSSGGAHKHGEPHPPPVPAPPLGNPPANVFIPHPPASQPPANIEEDVDIAPPPGTPDKPGTITSAKAGSSNKDHTIPIKPILFNHPDYSLTDGNILIRNKKEGQTIEEMESLLNSLGQYVQDTMKTQIHFIEHWIPSNMDPNDPHPHPPSLPPSLPAAQAAGETTEAPPSTPTKLTPQPSMFNVASTRASGKCVIHLTENVVSCKKLLVVLQNQVGSQPGIWSRSLCIDKGLNAGSMLPTLQKAASLGYGIVVLNPNANSFMMDDPENPGQKKKMSILGSSTPTEHVITCWDEIIYPQTSAEHIYILGYGNGGGLAKDILLRQLAKDNVEMNRIRAIATIESSQMLEIDDPNDVKEFLSTRAVNFDSNDARAGYQLCKLSTKLGVTCMSAGPLPEDQPNVACTIQQSLDAAFRFFGYVHTSDTVKGAKFHQSSTNPPANLGSMFHSSEANAMGVSPAEASVADVEVGSKRDILSGMQKLFSWRHDNSHGDHEDGQIDKHTLGVKDFDLLKVVGKGAFGKVMLVRKKSAPMSGQIFAMKVLKKSVIAAKGQVEHTKSERDILFEVRHPFVVFLRFAFQSDEKLYLITDFYAGGSLFYHLRKSRCFSEVRARFYASELLLALAHLHSHQIIYRDLKLENVLMDGKGHVALTDFGLSKQHVQSNEAASTFCGTAEYIAPELLKGKRYGAAVDWWSFGILLYEMQAGRTPFYDKNRKIMFFNIMNSTPQFPLSFSEKACSVLRALLTVDPTKRLGVANAEELKKHKFFSSIDWEKLYNKELRPVYIPDVSNELDCKYVPKTYLRAEAKDSIVQPCGKDDKLDFQEFTYAGEQSVLNK